MSTELKRINEFVEVILRAYPQKGEMLRVHLAEQANRIALFEEERKRDGRHILKLFHQTVLMQLVVKAAIEWRKCVGVSGRTRRPNAKRELIAAIDALVAAEPTYDA